MKQRKNDSARRADPTRKALYVTRAAASPADPEGSYTGRPKDPFETPQQDADDL